jgi:predicted nucleic acid-binding protein
MTLVDTSVWIDHFWRRSDMLAALLGRAEVMCHPFIVGEVACGRLRRRAEILELLGRLPQVPVTEHEEVLTFVETHRLMGSGIGWIDAHLFASARLAGLPIWTAARRLETAAARLGLAQRRR